MKIYSAFGFTIRSDIRCGLSMKEGLPPNITIQQGKVANRRTAGLKRISPFAGYSDDRVWQIIPGLIRVHATAEKIVWQADKNVSPRFVLEFLLHTALPFTLLCRGFYVRTGAALQINDHNVFFPGLGLSASAQLAEELVKAGAGYFSEGLCAARKTDQGSFEILPGLPRIRCTNTRDRSDGKQAKTVRDGLALGLTEPTDSFCSMPQPLTDIIITAAQENRQAPQLNRINGMERLRTLQTGVCLPGYPIESSARQQLWSDLMAMTRTLAISEFRLPDQSEPGSLSRAIYEVFS